MDWLGNWGGSEWLVVKVGGKGGSGLNNELMCAEILNKQSDVWLLIVLGETCAHMF